MTKIISFAKYHSKAGDKEAKRYKALAHNKLQEFTCNNCGNDFDVIDDEYPEVCPICLMVLDYGDLWEDD